MLKRFKDCPLGTRFKYVGHERTYIILDHYGLYGDGKVAVWDGLDQEATIQQVFSAEESKEACEALEIILVA